MLARNGSRKTMRKIENSLDGLSVIVKIVD